jgi:hypothetical protein
MLAGRFYTIRNVMSLWLPEVDREIHISIRHLMSCVYTSRTILNHGFHENHSNPLSPPQSHLNHDLKLRIRHSVLIQHPPSPQRTITKKPDQHLHHLFSLLFHRQKAVLQTEIRQYKYIDIAISND